MSLICMGKPLLEKRNWQLIDTVLVETTASHPLFGGGEGPGGWGQNDCQSEKYY